MKTGAKNSIWMADSIFVIAIWLTAFYWIFKSFLDIFTGYNQNFIQQLIMPGTDEIWHRIIVFFLFIVFGSHMQFTAGKRRQAEKKLNRSEEQYRTILQDLDDSYFEVDLAGNMTFFNDATCRTLGYTEDELMGMNNRSYMDKENAEKVSQAFSKIYTTGIPSKGFDYEIIKKDGSKRTIEIAVSLIKDSGGQRIGFKAICRDITERKTLEAQLHQSQKMEAIGTLAGGVAHDFNNLLTTILGYADFALSSIDKDNPLYGDIEEIKEAGNRAVSLTSQLLAFSRKQIIQPKILDLNEGIQEIEKMLRRLIGENIELHTTLESGLRMVHADPGQIDQVTMNLAVNARDAMPQGGKLIIETANVDLTSDYFRDRGLDDRQGPYVMLAVSDTGIGMDEETQAHIFEPFFTTKALGKGTGLGLSTVYGIVKQSGGFIWAYSEPGQGTAFKIYFPEVRGKATQKKEEYAGIETLNGSETVLVVEDDDLLRKMAEKVLRHYGYEVLIAQDGREALSLSTNHNGLIHIMVTDVVMPGMSGREVAEHLQPLRSEMQVLYMSGYTDKVIVSQQVLDPETDFLQKPFAPEDLVRRIREILDR